MTSTNEQQTVPVSIIPSIVPENTLPAPSATHSTEMVSTNSQLTSPKTYLSSSVPVDTLPTLSAPEPTVRASMDEFPTTLAPATAKPSDVFHMNAHESCPDMTHGDNYTQAEFLNRLTDACRYDRLTRPGGNVQEKVNGELGGPVDVYVQIDISHIEAAEHLVSIIVVFIDFLV